MVTETDIAIIGGGVSGSYSAWRLKKGFEGKSITLFEHSDRIGGRLFSRKMPGMSNVVAELGGMRFIPDTQPLVTQLIDRLGLKVTDFPMGNSDPEINSKKNYFYLRGKHLLSEDLSNPNKVPYNLSWSEQGKNPDELQKYVMNMLVPGALNLTLAQWFGVEVLKKSLYKIGYWNLLQMFLTSEAYEFMRDAGGYDANVANASAVSQLPVADFGPQVKYKTLTHGYQSLPEDLVKNFEDAGGTLVKNRRLRSIVKKEGKYELSFVQTITENFATRDDERHPETKIVIADKVILAMPRRSIELIEYERFDKSFKMDYLESVLIQEAFKIFLAYDYPWWRALGLYAGRSITDLPIRQVYYFGSEADYKGDSAGNNRSLLMASYNDIGSVPFWKGFENDDPYAGTQYGLRHGLSSTPASAYTATQSMVESAQKQIEEIHGQRKLPMPYSAIFHDWSDDPYGGGWHEWKAGFRYDQIITKMVKPLDDENVYIIGEAYSNNQGWVEGALETSNDMMKRFFNLNFLP